jgi:adenylate cyclase
VGAPFMRLLGKARAAKNPRWCADCLTKTPIGGAEIELSLLFADVRGSTSLAEHIRPAEFMQLLNRFYEVATEVLVRTDALVDKFVGDEVIGLYVPGFAGQDHARRAVQAAEELLRATGHAEPGGPWLPIGIGVHTGIAFVGAVGSAGSVTDITALGDAVNSTARLASAAAAGEVLVSEASCSAAGLVVDDLERRQLELKGRREPMDVRVLRVMPEQPVAASSS